MHCNIISFTLRLHCVYSSAIENWMPIAIAQMHQPFVTHKKSNERFHSMQYVCTQIYDNTKHMSESQSQHTHKKKMAESMERLFAQSEPSAVQCAGALRRQARTRKKVEQDFQLYYCIRCENVSVCFFNYHIKIRMQKKELLIWATHSRWHQLNELHFVSWHSHFALCYYFFSSSIDRKCLNRSSIFICSLLSLCHHCPEMQNQINGVHGVPFNEKTSFSSSYVHFKS